MRQDAEIWRALLALALLSPAGGGAATEPAPRPAPACPCSRPSTRARRRPLRHAGDRRRHPPRARAAPRPAISPARPRCSTAASARHPGLAELHAARAAVAMLAGDAAARARASRRRRRPGLPRARRVRRRPALRPARRRPRARRRAWRRSRRARRRRPRRRSPAPVVAASRWSPPATPPGTPTTERLEPRFSFAGAPTPRCCPPRPKTAAYDLLREHVAARPRRRQPRRSLRQPRPRPFDAEAGGASAARASCLRPRGAGGRRSTTG